MEYDNISEINSPTHIDRALVSIIAIAAGLSITTVIIFSIYVLGGTLLLYTGDVTLPYQFLSAHNDPVFNTLATVAGITIGTACIALVFFALVSQNREADIGIVVFFALVGLGFAAGLVRMSLTVTLRFVVQFIP
jgi:hypothetical protein